MKIKRENILFEIKNEKYKEKYIGGIELILEEDKHYDSKCIYENVPVRGSYGKIIGYKKEIVGFADSEYTHSDYSVKAELEYKSDESSWNPHTVVYFPKSRDIKYKSTSREEILNYYEELSKEFKKIDKFDISKWFDIDESIEVSKFGNNSRGNYGLGIKDYHDEFEKTILKIDCDTKVMIKMIRYKNIIAINRYCTYTFSSIDKAKEAFCLMKEHFSKVKSDRIKISTHKRYFNEFQTTLREIILKSQLPGTRIKVLSLVYDDNERIISAKIVIIRESDGLKFKLLFDMPTYGDVYHRGADINGKIEICDRSFEINDSERTISILKKITEQFS